MSGIKLIVSDLDGTLLLSPDHQLREAVLGVIHRFQLRGGYFTIATGRPLLTARRTIERLGIELPVIPCNGGHRGEGQTGRIPRH
ncbi:HAD family hydrolase [Paenibacillus ginsengihumi]|uniref:HAD family hydrolase n=1 Tax=Paenibacillus ginsengihumi TaxID=431596 RepID=UPI00035D5F65|nr:HAD family hydrolase [Paenibacillus ginsengihumi]